MKIINKPRRSGKTSELIKMASESNGYIVCMNKQHAEGVANQAKNMGFDINFPITFSEFLRGSYNGKGIKSFLFDELGLMLQNITSVPIEAISISEEA